MAEVLEIKEHHTAHQLPTPDNGEGGEKSPMNISYGKTMMWYFLLSDAFTFSAFLIAYACLRLGHKWWPNPNDVFNAMPFMGHHKIPMGFVSIMTFILIMSSVFVVRAVQEGHRMNKNGVMYWMFWGILGGAAFLGCQAWEWQHLLAEGMRPFYNVFYEGKDGLTTLWNIHEQGKPMFSPGPVAFGALFFGITGFHGFHVFTGVCLNIWGFFATANGTFEKRGHYEMIEKLGLYWHFVDLVWVFVFLAFYLM
ncbi:MAG TPA: cytochrome c oxidase subunit 3 [Chitinophagales bacterium]|nr:cytochrome c oxidase subunit 3 [Chitinophagales bacterium]